jgi:hypothetical protein
MKVVFTPWPYDAVARGAALLDEKVPDWREHITIDQLDMGDCALCVLGQCFGDFVDGLEELGIDDDDARPGSYYGFDRLGTRADAYERLTAAWREELAR